ncbi:MAG: glycosyltransferase family 2 protein [Pirellulaceae bacterium]
MEIASLGLLLGVAILLIAQAVFVVRFRRLMQTHSTPAAEPAPAAETAGLPSVAIVMAVRGTDPFLRQSLDRLLNQEYPDFNILIVVDSQSDDAWNAIEEAQASDDQGRIQVEVLRNPARTCSLKNSALLQAIATLDEDREVVAFFDGDVLPSTTWLRDLTAPLADPAVGAVTGNRWYTPGCEQRKWGSAVRYLWNTGAVVQMWVNRMVWAGSMAIRRSALREDGLVDIWRRSMSTDSVVFSAMKKQGLRVAYAHEVMMLNREEIALPQFTRWVSRQLTMARLYHPKWFMVVGQTAGIAAIQLGGLALAVASVATQQWGALGMSLLAVALYWAVSLLFALMIEQGVRVQLARQGEQPNWSILKTVPRLAIAMIVTNTIFPALMLVAATTRRVVWRGIAYDVNGPFQIQRGDYRPFRHSAPQTDTVV